MRFYRPFLKPDDGQDEEMDINALLGFDSGPPPQIDTDSDSDMGGMDIDALLEALGNDDSEALSGSMPSFGGAMDADEQLMRMLEMDAAAEGTPDSTTTSFDSEAEPSEESPGAFAGYGDDEDWSDFAYDSDPDAPPPSAEGAEAGEKPAPRRQKKHGLPRRGTMEYRLQDVSVGRILGTAGVILLFIFGAGVAAYFGIVHVYGQRAAHYHATAGTTVVAMPHNVANSNHFINVNELEILGRESFSLERLSFGLRGSSFQFSNTFNPDDYTIVLHDQDGTLFPRNRLDFAHDEHGRGTVLNFGAIHPTSRVLTLNIQESGTDETVSFNFTLEGHVILPSTKFINNPVQLVGAEGFAVDSAAFSNTASEINFVRHVDFDGDLAFVLRDGISTPVANNPELVEFYFPEHNIVLGRQTFGPLRNLDTIATLTFNNLDISQPIPVQYINVGQLFRDSPEYEQDIELQDYTLRLERMGWMGNLVILVMHGHRDGRRFATEIDTTLYIPMPGGWVLEVDGVSHSSPRGTDVVFSVPVEYFPDARAVLPTELSVAIYGVSMNRPTAELAIDLAQHQNTQSPARRAAEQYIEAAFVSRLAYKSQEIPFAYITGFDYTVINNRGLMRHYSPISRPDEDIAKYGARVIASTFAEDGTLLAIVEEEWVTEYEGMFTVLNRLHQVEAIERGGMWIIVNNIVL